MKTINSLILSLATLFVLGACEEDGDKYYLSSLTSNELIASTDNIVLTEATARPLRPRPHKRPHRRMCYRWHGQTVHWLSAIRTLNRLIC